MEAVLALGAILALIVVAATFFRSRNSTCNVPVANQLGHWMWGLSKISFEHWTPMLSQEAKKAGPIYQIRVVPWLPSSTLVVINDINLMKDLSGRKEFASRDPIQDAGALFINPKKKGIVIQDWTPSWRNLHKFTVSTLNSFGFGKHSMEKHVLEEADALVEAMASTSVFDPAELLRVAVANVLCKVVFDERFEIRQQSELHQKLQIAALAFLDLAVDPVYIPWPGLVNFYKNANAKRICEAVEYVRSHIKASVAKHEDRLDENSEPRDFIDAFIRERRRQPGEDHLSEDNLINSVLDLFLAGTDTTSALLTWTIAWMLHNPDIHRRLKEELTSVLGIDGAPSTTLLPQLHYLRAFMDEVQRMSCVADFAVPHRCTEESAEFNGYTITKNESIWMNIYAIHYDPAIWGDADVFRPERFLDIEGQYKKSNNLATFGFGKRYCLGERLANMEHLIFTTRIIQRLDFKVAEGTALPDMYGSYSLSRIPSKYTIEAKKWN